MNILIAKGSFRRMNFERRHPENETENEDEGKSFNHQVNSPGRINTLILKDASKESFITTLQNTLLNANNEQ